MKNKIVSITKNKFEENIVNIDTIPLIKGNNEWFVETFINGRKEKLIFDTGCDEFIVLKKGLISEKKIKYSLKGNKEIIINKYANIEINNSIRFDDIYIKDNAKTINNLLGIPLLWQYDRVVLDFVTGNIFLIHINDNDLSYNIRNKNKTKFAYDILKSITLNGYYEHLKRKLKIKYFNRVLNDTLECVSIERPKWYGKQKGESIKIDSIVMKVQDDKKLEEKIISIKYDDIIEIN